MSKDEKGIFEELLDGFTMGMIIDASRDKDGNPDRNKAAAMAMSMGFDSFDDAIELEARIDYETKHGRNKRSSFSERSNPVIPQSQTKHGGNKRSSYLGSYHEYDWRYFCEDGWEYGLDCKDYATEEEYEEALNEAKYGWREYCIDNDYDIDPEEFETEDEYLEMIYACDDAMSEYEDSLVGNEESGEECDDDMLVEKCDEDTLTIPIEITVNISSDEDYEKKKNARHKLITNNKDKVLAIKYLTESGQFLYSKAVKENFTLPISLPDETYCREYELADIICKIAKRDEDLSIKVWSWCVEQFLPYVEWDDYAADDMTNNIIDKLYRFPENYGKTLAHYMEEHSDFRTKIAGSALGVSGNISSVIVSAIQEELFDTAKAIFDICYAKIKDNWKEVIDFINEILWKCKNYDELESIEYFEKELFPIIKKCEQGMVKDEIEDWEKEIANYINNVEESCEKYEFSRRYAWRRKVPDGSMFNLDPRDYSSKEAYMERYEWKKYGWREWYCGRDICGLNVNNYETKEEFQQALDERREELRNKKREQEEEQRAKDTAEILNDKKIYTYCGVMLSNSGRSYSYRTEDTTIKVGDIVCVPVGKENKVVTGTVVSVGQYARIVVPYPVEQTRFIIDVLER